jgi:hypothetical protein
MDRDDHVGACHWPVETVGDGIAKVDAKRIGKG